MPDEIERRSMPWLNVVFDWEGVAAAAAAFLASLLLGGPLVAPLSAGPGGRRGGAV